MIHKRANQIVDKMPLSLYPPLERFSFSGVSEGKMVESSRMDGEGARTGVRFLNSLLPHTDCGDCGRKLLSEMVGVGLPGEECGHGQGALQG